MKRIILASNSPQRRKLLSLAGFRFTVRPSQVKEIKKIRTTVVDLVKENAYRKASDVAGRLRDGIVIGADTVVYGAGRLISKPRHLKEARYILKLLSSQPHWVYTGLAVMDAETRRFIADYEKTKIFFDRLSDEEIESYHRRTSPLDKAGGFDIEGRGGFFIRRIEGCYSNVIGLPLAKLRQMLQKMGVSVLGIVMMAVLAGCATEYNLATEQEETLLYGTEREVKIGDAVSRQFDEHFEINTDLDVNERVERILERLVKVCDRKELIYTVKVINEDQMNAVSLPGGYIYVYKKLMESVQNDDQLAAVIAHEMGHITARHSIKKLQAAYGYTLLQVLAVQTRDAQVAQGVSTAYLSIFLSYSRQDEFQADKLAVKYLVKAGYDPRAASEMLKKIKAEEDQEPLRSLTYWRTHPFLTERIAAVNQELTGQLEFRDYLNLTGNEERW